MGILEAIVLGLVEGLTEFLPVSSTGHLIMASQLLRLPDSEFLRSFEVIVQLGAIAAVAWEARRYATNMRVLLRVATAFVPAAVIGLAFYRTIKDFLGNPTLVTWTLALGGIVFIVFERSRGPRKETDQRMEQVTFRQAFGIGLCQALAVIPGVSRSGASIIGGLALGLPRAAAVEFSFLLAIPTMLAASGLDLLRSNVTFGPSELTMLAAGLVTAFVSAKFAIAFLMRYIRTHTFIPFGVYRILAAVGFWLTIG